ncbi:MAG: TonB-dependent receptor, partial [candidate division Zixibacteria bacterium]|nr:TonB-dependent receptor [candidate division Zixibacteria bacterium]
MIRTLFALLFLLFVTNQFCFAQEKQCLSGLIIDTKTEKPIPGVSVMVKGTDIGTISDSAGFFSIDDLPVGKQTLCVSHISYKSKTIKNIEIKSTAKPIELNIKLQSKLHSIKGITVTPSYFSIKSSEPAAQQSLTNNEIATVPQGGDDFFRAISRLPGIGSNDFSARMTIRGGEFGEVLVTLDGLKIYEPFHVKEVDGGAISIIDVAAIDGIDLITGGFGA